MNVYIIIYLYHVSVNSKCMCMWYVNFICQFMFCYLVTTLNPRSTVADENEIVRINVMIASRFWYCLLNSLSCISVFHRDIDDLCIYLDCTVFFRSAHSYIAVDWSYCTSFNGFAKWSPIALISAFP